MDGEKAGGACAPTLGFLRVKAGGEVAMGQPQARWDKP